MLRPFLAALVAGAALLGSPAVQAGTYWSIGINVPATGVVVSNGPRYYVEPEPVYYAPPPVVYYEPRYRPVHREVYYAPAPQVVYESHYRERRWDRHDNYRHVDSGYANGHRHGHGHGRHARHDHRWDGDRGHGPRRGN